MFILIISLLLVLSFAGPFGYYFLSGKKAITGKHMLIVNIASFFIILIGTVVCTAGGFVSAAQPFASVISVGEGMKYIAAALSTGIAAIGAGIAVASASSAALGAISEDPGAMGKALIFVALAEGIALYGLLISFMILG